MGGVQIPELNDSSEAFYRPIRLRPPPTFSRTGGYAISAHATFAPPGQKRRVPALRLPVGSRACAVDRRREEQHERKYQCFISPRGLSDPGPSRNTPSMVLSVPFKILSHPEDFHAPVGGRK